MNNHQKKPSIRFFYTYYLGHYYQDLLPVLVNHGWRVEVLISRAEYRAGMGTRFPAGVSIIHTPTLGFKPNGMAGKLMVMVTYMLFGIPFTLFGPSVDKNVFFTQPPLFSSLWGYLLKKIRRQTNYQVLQDIFPDIAIETGHIKRNSLLARSLTSVSRFALSRADHIGAIGRCMEDKLIQEGLSREKITLIPNWANADMVQSMPHETNPFRIEQGWQDRFVLVFAGNIGIPQYFDDLLEVCQRLYHKRPEFLTAFIGNGSRIATIRAYKEQHGLNNIVFVPYQSPEKQSEFLSAGDIHFVSLRTGIEGLAVPSKTYNIMAAGRPIIYQGESVGEIARLIDENAVGTTIPVNNPDLLEQAILSYMDNEELRIEQGKHARQVAETAASYQAANQRIIAWLQVDSKVAR